MLYDRREKESLQHRMIETTEGKKFSQCITCGERNVYGQVPGSRFVFKLVSAKKR